MRFNKGSVIVVLVALCAAALAAEEAQAVHKDDVDRNTVAPPQHTGRLNVGDLTIPSSLVNLLTNGGAVAAGILVLAAIVSLIAPSVGARLCSAFGYCDTGVYQAYSAGPNSYYGDYQGAYGQGGTYNNPIHQKRSIEYIAPVLKALGNAYEKYNHQAAVTLTKKAA